jgi:hypothetical protein
MPSLPDPLAPPEGYGERPAGNGPVTPGNDDGKCDVHEAGPLAFFGVPPVRCARPAVVRVWIACPHEHIGFVDLCPGHQYVTAGLPACGRCKAAGESSVMAILRREPV